MDFQLEYTVEVPATIEYKVRAFSRESAMHIVLSTCPSDLVSEECITQEGYENMSRDIVVPELTAASLPDVLFPIPDRVEYRNDGALLTPVNAN